jgi:hypothetical protein
MQDAEGAAGRQAEDRANPIRAALGRCPIQVAVRALESHEAVFAVVASREDMDVGDVACRRHPDDPVVERWRERHQVEELRPVEVAVIGLSVDRRADRGAEKGCGPGERHPEEIGGLEADEAAQQRPAVSV